MVVVTLEAEVVGREYGGGRADGRALVWLVGRRRAGRARRTWVVVAHANTKQESEVRHKECGTPCDLCVFALTDC
jgi:hypothetical protein